MGAVGAIDAAPGGLALADDVIAGALGGPLVAVPVPAGVVGELAALSTAVSLDAPHAAKPTAAPSAVAT